jgi:cell division protein ZapE
MKTPLLKIYENHIASGRITEDPPQREVIAKLDMLLDRLREAKKGFLGFGQSEAPQGLYIWGGVGRGKSMLMDMFADVARDAGVKTSRLHFHDFMVAVHDKIHDPKVKQKEDPARHVATAITDKAQLICFDEMEVRDIADAMIIARVMKGFFDDGGVLVATSNRHPDDLYLNGLHRERFVPFITLLKDKTEQHEIVSATDWRQRVLSGAPSWYVPDDAASRKQMDALFSQLTNNAEILPVSVIVAGREITIDHTSCNIGMVSFDDLCAKPLAARDYITLADRFSGLLIHGIPMMTEELRNESRRFMWLVDAFYDRSRFLVCSADAALKDIYSGQSWTHEFPRTVSRLTEMTKI